MISAKISQLSLCSSVHYVVRHCVLFIMFILHYVFFHYVSFSSVHYYHKVCSKWNNSRKNWQTGAGALALFRELFLTSRSMMMEE